MKFLNFFIVFCFIFITKAYSESIFFSCERFYIDSSGFSSLRAAESWYNKNLTVRIDVDKRKGYYKGGESNVVVKSNGKRFELKFPRRSSSGNMNYFRFYFLPNGEVHTELAAKAGFQTAGGAKYKCGGWPMN